MNRNRRFKVLLSSGLLLFMAGCSMLAPGVNDTRSGASSSLVDFLYPDGVALPDKTATARLEVPLRVGLGFLPSAGGNHALDEQDRNDLLAQVKAQFSALDYVQDIVVVPQTYLRSRNGLLAVDQVGRLYDLDVIGLVSYDQTLVSEARDSSVLYWTILGAYLVKGDSNEVSTFIDLAVIDIQSKKLLLRAGGTHHSQNNATLVDRASDARKDQRAGFNQATVDLVHNFAGALEQFETSIESSDDIKVVKKAGGSGALLLEVSGLFLLCLARRLRLAG